MTTAVFAYESGPEKSNASKGPAAQYSRRGGSDIVRLAVNAADSRTSLTSNKAGDKPLLFSRVASVVTPATRTLSQSHLRGAGERCSKTRTTHMEEGGRGKPATPKCGITVAFNRQSENSGSAWNARGHVIDVTLHDASRSSRSTAPEIVREAVRTARKMNLLTRRGTTFRQSRRDAESENSIPRVPDTVLTPESAISAWRRCRRRRSGSDAGEPDRPATAEWSLASRWNACRGDLAMTKRIGQTRFDRRGHRYWHLQLRFSAASSRSNGGSASVFPNDR